MACRWTNLKHRCVSAASDFSAKMQLLPVQTFVHRLSLAGHERLVMKSDGDPSVLVWKTQVDVGLAR